MNSRSSQGASPTLTHPLRLITLLGLSALAMGGPGSPGLQQVHAAGLAPARQALRGHVPAAVPTLQPLGRLAPSTAMHLAIGLPLRDTNALSALLKQIYDPKSPHYRQYLTPEQFTALFGPTEQDYQQVADFAKANGLTVSATFPTRFFIDVEGSAENVEKAFHVNLRTYQHPSENRQ